MVEFCPSVRLTYSTAMGQSGLFMRVNAERRSFCSVNHLGFFPASFHFGIYLWQNSHGPHDPSCVTTFMFFCYLFIYLFFYNQHFYFTQKKGNPMKNLTLHYGFRKCSCCNYGWSIDQVELLWQLLLGWHWELLHILWNCWAVKLYALY